jgi:type II secretion system protein L
MSGFDCLIVQRSRGWLIVLGTERLQLAADTGPDELASSALQLAQQADIKNPVCILAPDSESCFFATLSPSDDVDLRDRTALTFELEDHLPIDAESMVADFAVVPSNSPTKTVSAIAIEIQRWNEIVEAIESAGLTVRSIVPRAVLAASALAEIAAVDDGAELLLVDEGHCDCVTLSKRIIRSWKHLAINAESLRRRRLLDDVGEGLVVVAGASPSQQPLIRKVFPDSRIVDQEIDELVVQGARMLLAARSSRSFDLRRGALGPSDPLRAIGKQIRWAAVAVSLFLLALSIGGWWRTHRIEQQIANVRSEQDALFRQSFPDAKIPAALLKRVRSEHMKVLGSRGESSQVDIPVSAPHVLRQLIAALPADVRFRFKSISVLDGRVDLDLQVRSPVDAGTLAASLSAAGFEVKPPGTTQQDRRTFDSILEAQWVGTPRTAASAGDELSYHVAFSREAAG